MESSNLRKYLSDSKRIVIKVGTSTLTYENGEMNLARMEKTSKGYIGPYEPGQRCGIGYVRSNRCRRQQAETGFKAERVERQASRCRRRSVRTYVYVQ